MQTFRKQWLLIPVSRASCSVTVKHNRIVRTTAPAFKEFSSVTGLREVDVIPNGVHAES